MKEKQLFRILLLMFTIVISFSCNKKSDDTPTDTNADFFVRFKLDGTQMEFKGMTTGLFQTLPLTPTIYSGSFQGLQSSTAVTTNLFGIDVRDIVPIAINKNYTNIAISNTIQATFLYFDAAGNQYSSGYLATTASTDAVVRLTEITNTSVSGTFSGKMSTLSGTVAKTITEGSFKVKRL